MARSVLSVRVDEETKAYLEARAAREGSTVSKIAADVLKAPSFSDALSIIGVLQAPEGVEQVLGLADDPRLAGWDRAELADLGKRLGVLAKRWPR